MKILSIFLSLFIFQISVHAQGVKFIRENKPRYVEVLDTKFGVLVTDTILNIQYTKCLAGMESTTVDGECTGTAEELNWHDANEFSKQVGGKFRLPTQKEFKTYLENRADFKKLLSEYYMVKYDNSFEGRPYWTIEEGSSTNTHGAVAFKYDNDKVTLVIRQDGQKHNFIFVRNVK